MRISFSNVVLLACFFVSITGLRAQIQWTEEFTQGVGWPAGWQTNTDLPATAQFHRDAPDGVPLQGDLEGASGGMGLGVGVNGHGTGLDTTVTLDTSGIDMEIWWVANHGDPTSSPTDPMGPNWNEVVQIGLGSVTTTNPSGTLMGDGISSTFFLSGVLTAHNGGGGNPTELTLDFYFADTNGAPHANATLLQTGVTLGVKELSGGDLVGEAYLFNVSFHNLEDDVDGSLLTDINVTIDEYDIFMDDAGSSNNTSIRTSRPTIAFSANGLDTNVPAAQLDTLHPALGYNQADFSSIAFSGVNYDGGLPIPEPAPAAFLVLPLLAGGVFLRRRPFR